MGGKTHVSLVGFLFRNTRIKGIPIPFHRDFEEINLRFYVRHKAREGWRRGVVFIREIVPRRAIAWVARMIYNEPYLALPTSHVIENGVNSGEIKFVTYAWGRNNHLKLKTRGQAQPLLAGSEQEFITEHYWGYTAQRNGRTLEYQVEHPRWRVWDAESAELNCDIAGLYGDAFVPILKRAPSSALLAEGSAVRVGKGVLV